MKTSFIPSPSHKNSISQPKPTVQFGMNQPNAAASAPAGDTVSRQTPQANLSKEQLQSRWDKLLEAIKAGTRRSALFAMQQSLTEIPKAQRFGFLMKTGEYRSTLLHDAAWHNEPEVVECLLESLTNPAQRWQFLTNTNQFGENALHWAVWRNNPEVVKCLLESLPDPAQRWQFLSQPDKGRNPLTLLKLKDSGMTALHKAAEHDTSYMMNCLLESLNTLVPDPDKRLELLLQQTTAFRDTALHKAAEHDTSYVMNCLLESLNTLVPNPDKRLELLQQTEGSGKTVLHKAAQNKSSDVMKCLLESLDKLVPDPAKRWQFLTNTNQFGDTALHDALRNENPKVMKCLLESLDKLVPDRAKRWNFLTQANAYGKTALDLAIDHKKMNQAALLLANGADPNAFTDKQPTEATQLDNAALLLANAADPNAFTDEQPTAATQWVTTIPNACRNISKTTLNELASVTAEQKKKEH